MILSRCTVSRKARGIYSRISTTVPPTYIVAANQLLSGDECHIGMAMRVRSSRVIESAKATVIAARVTLRCVRTHPFGLPVVPEV